MANEARDPNHLLAAENDPALNETFYSARPYRYFIQRLESLMLVAGRPTELETLIAEGVTIGKLKAGGHPREERTEDEEAEAAQDRERYVISETEVLVHHAAETLLRLYLAHEPLPPCPWLTMAEERSFAAFKQRVRKLSEDLSQGRRRQELARAFFGHHDRYALAPTPPEDPWNMGIKNVATWLGWYADHFLDANVYNAAKHGFAVQPGEAAFQLGDDELISRSGPAIEYLETTTDDEGRVRWQRTTQWVDVERFMAYVFMAARLMKALMEVGRARYGKGTLPVLDLFVEPAFEKTIAADEIQFNKLSFGLLYYRDGTETTQAGS